MPFHHSDVQVELGRPQTPTKSQTNWTGCSFCLRFHLWWSHTLFQFGCVASISNSAIKVSFISYAIHIYSVAAVSFYQGEYWPSWSSCSRWTHLCRLQIWRLYRWRWSQLGVHWPSVFLAQDTFSTCLDFSSTLLLLLPPLPPARATLTRERETHGMYGKFQLFYVQLWLQMAIQFDLITMKHSWESRTRQAIRNIAKKNLVIF